MGKGWFRCGRSWYFRAFVMNNRFKSIANHPLGKFVRRRGWILLFKKRYVLILSCESLFGSASDRDEANWK
jgi:hypothetical protein